VKIMNEIIAGMKIIKLYCWDEAFAKKAQDVRLKELVWLRKMAYLVGIAFSVILLSVPTILPVVVFAAASNIYGVTLTASKAFTVISLFNILRFPFAFLPMAAVEWVTTIVAMKRIQNFLLMPEMDADKVVAPEDPAQHAIQISNAAFKWEVPAPVPEGKTKGRGRRGKGK
jgi:ABC-type multidrug transport system fused ATPase/permease subunit